MGWRFFRRARILPGVKLNLSRSGPSVRLGVRGAGVTFGGRRGTRTTVGLPGTGLYNTSTGKRRRRAAAPHRTYASASPPTSSGTAKGCLIIAGVLVAIWLAAITNGLVLIALAIGVGLWVWWHRTRPAFYAARLIKQASTAAGDQAVPLLHQAITLDPHGPKTLAACGDWFTANKCWADAADCYSGCLSQKADWDIEAKYVKALVFAGHLDEAIPRLEQVRSMVWLTHESRASITSLLALSFLIQGDFGQAHALVSQEPLQRHNLEFGLQQCLYLRAASRYLMGQKSKALGDLDRLYAVNSAYPSLAESKSEMLAGTFTVSKPSPYPDWYPSDGRLSDTSDDVEALPPPGDWEAPSATSPTEELSSPEQSAPSPWTSPDGKWLWNGSAWVANEPK